VSVNVPDLSWLCILSFSYCLQLLVCVLCIWCGIFFPFILRIRVEVLSISLVDPLSSRLSVRGCCFTMSCLVFCALNAILIGFNWIHLWFFLFLFRYIWMWPILFSTVVDLCPIVWCVISIGYSYWSKFWTCASAINADVGTPAVSLAVCIIFVQTENNLIPPLL
jgi:hypothetical protein